MKLVISGSRSIKDCSLLEKELSKYSPDLIICGGAKGVDRCAMIYATQHNIPFKIFYPNYTMYGKIAPLENLSKMAAYGNELLAFWDGKSKGTIHIIREMENLDKPVRVINMCGVTRKPSDKKQAEEPKKDVGVSSVEKSS